MTAPDAIFKDIKVNAFVGPAGTGKSQRAQMVAEQVGAEYIIDDGLVIRRTEIVAGRSAKTERNQIRAIRRALFEFEDHRTAVQKFFEGDPRCSVMVIATSEGMAEKITEALGFPRPQSFIHIDEVATHDEMAKARRQRKNKGQHVIPVSHVQVRKNFAGKLVGRLRDLWQSKAPYEGEKTIVRPPFSFYGDVHIDPHAIEDIARYVASKIGQVASVASAGVSFSHDDSLSVVMELGMRAGPESMKSVAESVRRGIAKSVAYLSGLEVVSVSVSIVSMEFADAGRR